MTVQVENVAVDISVELGRKQVTIAEVRPIQVGDSITFDKLAGEAFDVRINGRAFAQGEVVVINNKMAVRLTRLIDRTDPS